MSSALRVVAVVGSPTSSATSRTLLLVRHLLASLQQRVHASVELVELAPIARSVGQSLSRDEVEPAVEQALQAIETAELLVVAAPVHRGSYPGLFKHLVDFIGLEALVDTPVLLAATGGSERHALVIDHQLRRCSVSCRRTRCRSGCMPRLPTLMASTSTVQRCRPASRWRPSGVGHLATQALAVAAPLRRIA